jgi:hypothetical protein
MRQHPAAAPALFGGMVQLNRRLTTPAAVIAFIAGIYLASDAEVWDETWAFRYGNWSGWKSVFRQRWFS